MRRAIVRGLPGILLVAAMMSASPAFASDLCVQGDGKGDAFGAAYRQCTASAPCTINIATCPDIKTKFQSWVECVQEKETVFDRCINDCRNRAMVQMQCKNMSLLPPAPAFTP
jgi:hypothetical protein